MKQTAINGILAGNGVSICGVYISSGAIALLGAVITCISATLGLYWRWQEHKKIMENIENGKQN